MKQRRWKRAAVVCVGVLLDIIGHGIANQLTAEPEVLPPNNLADVGLVVPAILVYLLATFGLLAAVFLFLQPRLPYTPVGKGVAFGLAFGGLWFIGVLESSLVLGTSVGHELVMGLADGVPILIMGTLLGAATATARHPRLWAARATIWAVPIIAVCYMVGRYVAYLVLGIDSAVSVDPWGTFLWTLGMGIWVGIMYWLLEPGVTSTSSIGRAVVFGGLVYGIDWTLFNAFLLVGHDMDVLLLILRPLTDLVSVTLGVYAAETLLARNVRPPADSGMREPQRDS